MGILHRNILGHNITAVYFPELPVEMLVSTQGLKSNHWETHFMVSGDYIQNVKTGRILSVETSANGLPTIDLKFDEMENDEIQNSESFICSPCDDAFQGLLPERIRRAINLSKKQRKGNLSSENVLERKAIKASKLLQRWRMCHIHQPGLNNFKCFDCLEYKGKSKSHSKTRAKQHQTPKPLMLFACDFFGKVKPTSFRGNKWVFLFICDKCGYVHGKPIRNKSQAPEVLQEFITELRGKCGVNVGSTKNDKGEIIFIGIRSDNEPVLRSEKWELVCSKNNLFESHSIPYEPEMNGKIERCVQTTKSAMRTTCANVDPRVWDFAIEHIIKIMNLSISSAATRCNDGILTTPNQILAKMSSNPLVTDNNNKKEYLRRFGCLTYFKINIPLTDDDKNKALQPKMKKGIHLGFSDKNSGWLVGLMKNGILKVYETRNCIFLEDILVKNIEQLAAPDPPIFQQLIDRTNASVGNMSAAGSGSAPDVGEVTQYQHQGLTESDWLSGKEGQFEPIEVTQVKLDIDSKPIEDNFTIDRTDEAVFEPCQFEIESESERSETTKKVVVENESAGKPIENIRITEKVEKPQNISTSLEIPKYEKVKDIDVVSKGGQTRVEESKFEFGPSAVKRKRGRPKGSLDKIKRKPKRNRAQMQGINPSIEVMFAEIRKSEEDKFGHLECEEGEEMLEAEVFLAKAIPPSKPGDSVRPTVAFNPENPERPKWIESKNLEHTRLKAYDTWRKLTVDEEQQWREGKLQAVPCALL